MTLYIERKIPIKFGSQSCIGVSGEPPFSWANYFWLIDDESPSKDSYDKYHAKRVLNFWAENLKAAMDKFLPNGMVNIYDYGEWCLIKDDRIPDEWYYHGINCTGCFPPSKQILEDIASYFDDRCDTLGAYLNPVEYYEKRGAVYNPKTGWITYKINRQD